MSEVVEVVEVPKYVIDATHHGGYFMLWQKYVCDGMTGKEAWEEVEDLLNEYGFPGRYSSYESFTSGKSKIRQAIRKHRAKANH